MLPFAFRRLSGKQKIEDLSVLCVLSKRKRAGGEDIV
jgi:hypothetical protein